MKKFIFALAGLCLLSIPGLADNNIKMVTYFPVPYVSYGDLTVTSTWDVGLLGSCNLDVGEGLEIFKSSSSNQALNTGSLIVRQGALSLNSSLASSSVNGSVLNVGSGEISGSLEFGHNLVVDQMAGNKVQSLEARNKAYLSGLTLFGQPFPVCEEANHEINWKKLTVNGKEGVFLVCGSGESSEIETTCAENPNQEKCCINEQTWNGTTCVCVPDPNRGADCVSCQYTYSNTVANTQFKVQGKACEIWDDTGCMFWPAVACHPAGNVWIKGKMMQSTLCGVNVTSDILPSHPVEGDLCGTSTTVYVREGACRSSSCYCTPYECKKVPPSGNYTKI